eukprot:5314828-Amphidinium_carterae.1
MKEPHKQWLLPVRETTRKKRTLTTKTATSSLACNKIAWCTGITCATNAGTSTFWKESEQQRLIWSTDEASTLRQRPDWCTVREAASSGLYISVTALLCISTPCLRIERNCRPFTKEHIQRWSSQLCWTTK